ncbi:MAG: flagellar basal body-associated FliL family protein [Lachnospiraceae bacterium]
MKKNLMSVLILALVLANLILTAILMISVVPQTKKANELISKVCTAIDLELESGKEDGTIDVPMDQIEVLPIAEGATMTINLKDGADSGHFAIVSVSLALDTKNKDYKKLGAEAITAKQDLIKGEIINIVSSHTIEEMKADTVGVQNEILAKLQKMFDSNCIVSVTFTSYNYQ